MTSSTLLRHLLVCASLSLVACGGSTDAGSGEPDDTGGSPDGSSDTSTTDGSGGDATSDTSSTDASGDDTIDAARDSTATDASTDGDARPICADEPTKNKCQTCCAAEHPAGAKTFFAALLACACTDAVCKSVCATSSCASPPTAATDACKTCLADSLRTAGADAGADGGADGKCVDSVKTACSSDGKCVAYATCLGTCK